MKKNLFLLAAILVFVSCNSNNNDDKFTELLNNRQLWQSKNINNYKWNERLSCFCGGILNKDINVVSSVKDTVVYDDSILSSEVDRQEVYNTIFKQSRTVDEAFNFIEELLSQDLFSLTIEYNESYGYPTLINIDYQENVADDEIAYIYSSFEQRI